MKILLLRHGKTAGNLERRYVGRTDESLTKEAAEELLLGELEEKEDVWKVYCSPMKRCMETARLLFGISEAAESKEQPEIIPVSGLEECDFGRFEYKNYEELKSDRDYQKFLDSGGRDGFPEGERVEEFKRRSAKIFGKILERERLQEVKTKEYPNFHVLRGNSSKDKILAFVVHGGTIMAVMEAFARPSMEYFSWQCKNCEGFLCEAKEDDEGTEGKFYLTQCRKIRVFPEKL